MAASLLAREPVAPRADRGSARHAMLTDLDRVETYPVLSETSVRVLGLVNNCDVSVAEVAAIVRRDGVLAARVMSAANTWKYRGKSGVTDVQQAVLRLGLQECGKLLCAVGMTDLYSRYPTAVRARCDALLRHSLFVARLASGVAQTAGLGPPGPAFAAGLLHDIGRVVACVKCPEAAAEADPIDYEEDGDTLPRERDVLGIDHCAVGFQFATRNNLPEGVARVTLNHHRPAEEHLQRELVALVAVADRIANHAQREHNIAGYDPADCPYFGVLAAEWSGPRRESFGKALPGIVVQAFRDTRAMLKSCL